MASRSISVLTARTGSRPVGLALALCAALVLALPGTVVAASTTIHVQDEIDFTFPLPGLTNACGYPVLSSIVGKVNIVVTYDADGHPVREVDSGVVTRTIFAPSTGRAVSFPFSLNAVADYAPDGTAIVQATGLFVNAHIPGDPQLRFLAGREVWSAVIVEIRPDGVPIFELVDLLSRTGRDEGVFADICAALDS